MENIKVVKFCDIKIELLVDEEEDVIWVDVGKVFDRICMIFCIL